MNKLSNQTLLTSKTVWCDICYNAVIVNVIAAIISYLYSTTTTQDFWQQQKHWDQLVSGDVAVVVVDVVSCCYWCCCFLFLLMLLLQMLFLVVVVVVFNLRALFQDTLGQRVLHFWRYQSCSVTCVNLIFFLTFFSIYYTPFDLFTSAKRYCDRTCLLVS